MTEWQDKIKFGMELIMKGCKENTTYFNCRQCPFDKFCTSIYKDEEHNFTSPDSWEEEGLDLTN